MRPPAAAALLRMLMARQHRRLGHLASVVRPSAADGHRGGSELSTQRRAEAAADPSSVTLTVDLDRPGKHWGSIVVPWSDNRGAWANKLVPICIVNGPWQEEGVGWEPANSALLCAGNHGDEYEGQIALHKFCRELDPSAVHGRLIVIPTLSMDAALQGSRTWPDSDQTNFNRRFPGTPSGTVAAQLAYFLTCCLMPIVETVMDLHTGGSSINFTPMATFKGVADPAMHKRFVEAHMALLMPRAQYGGQASASVAVTGAAGLLPTEAEDQGKLVITGEFGGGGYIAAERHRLILRGIRNCVRHLGLLRDEAPTTRTALGEEPTLITSAADPSGYLMAPRRGFWEACVDPMTTVSKGQLVGRIHAPEEPCLEPVEVVAPFSGFLNAARAITMTRPGDVVAVLAKEVTMEELMAG